MHIMPCGEAEVKIQGQSRLLGPISGGRGRDRRNDGEETEYFKGTWDKGMCSAMFVTALFVIARTSKQPKCLLTKEQIRKMWYIYTMEF